MKGLHQEDEELQESYLDWFFLHHFGKGPSFWRNLPDWQISSLVIMEQEKELKDWKNSWGQLFKMFSK